MICCLTGAWELLHLPPAACQRTDIPRLQGTWYDSSEKADYRVVLSADGQRLRVFATTCSTLLTRSRCEDGHDWWQGDEFHANGRPIRKVRMRLTGPNEAIRKILQQGAWSTPSCLVRLTEEEQSARGKYVSLDSLWKALRPSSSGGPPGTTLIKGSWFIDWMKGGRTLPRRQDLPRGAVWQLEELKPSVERCEVCLITVSHCWVEEDHPDPAGEQMRILASILETRLAVAYPADGSPVYHDAALFIDWASLYQEAGGIGRTAAQESCFQSALQDVSLWYAHERTESWLLSCTPDGVMPAANRGWPFFEKAVSCLSTPDHMLFDMGEYHGEDNWYDIYRTCKAGRMPAMTPLSFNEALNGKCFTQASDEAQLQQQYAETFHVVLPQTKEISVSNLEWLDGDAETLSKVIPYCSSLAKIDAKSNEICAAGAGAICKACTVCPVEVISLTKNPLGDAGARAIADSIGGMTNLKTLWLNECSIGDEGVLAVMSQLEHSKSDLQNMFVFDNLITDTGAEAVADLLPQCPKLFQVGIGGNQISEAVLQRLQEAWDSVPRARGACIYLR